MITQEKLKEILNYDLNTGIFTYKKRVANCIQIGNIAGTIDKYGYTKIRICGKDYKSHRLAWLYVYGILPTKSIDHINGIKNDNSINNLRDITNRKNHQNRARHRDGKLVGTSFHKKYKKWRSTVYICGKLKHLGYYETQELAHEAYLNKLKEQI